MRKKRSRTHPATTWRWGRWSIWLVLAVLVTPLLACRSDPVPIRHEQFVFGTRVELTVVHDDPAAVQAALAAVSAMLTDLHRRYHAWEPSELSALNAAIAAGTPAIVDARLAAILNDARQWVVATERLFDPGIGALVALWGFHQSDFATYRPPDAAAVAALVARRPSLVDLTIWPLTDPDTPCRVTYAQPHAGACVVAANPAVQIDLGGYLKGYALDRAAELLREQGITRALINIGGNVLALGQPSPRRPWRVALHHPRLADPLAILPLYDGEAIGTSGDYQRYYLWEGQRYHHLIDPRSGYPSHGAQAFTVIIPSQPKGGSGLRSDLLTKPLFITGDQWPQYASRFGVTYALRVTPTGSVEVSTSMHQRLTWVTKPDQLKVVSLPTDTPPQQ